MFPRRSLTAALGALLLASVTGYALTRPPAWASPSSARNALLLRVGQAGGLVPAPREQQLFDNGWRFHLGDVSQGQLPALADKTWRQVDLPHRNNIQCQLFFN
jgi:hypothetical protein